MRRFSVAVVAGAVLLLVGCTNEESGGPGVRTSDDQKQVMPPGNTFRVNVPGLPQAIKQGESKTIEFKIDREKNFDQDVTITFEGLPKGVSIDPPMFVIAAGDVGAKATVNADADAALGEFEVVVKGKPATGAIAQSELKLKIEK